MSWNPLKRLSVTRPTSAQSLTQGLDEQLELERHLVKLQQLDDISKKLHKDMKKSTECLAELAKHEQKLTSNLSASPLCHYDCSLRVMAEEYYSIVCQLDQNTNELILVSQKAFVDPMKRFSAIFGHMGTAVKKREQQTQEVQKWQTRFEKQQEKEKTGPNIAKTEQLRRQLAQANEELSEQNAILLRELPKLFDGRMEYIQPCLEALIRGEVEYFGENIRLFNELAQSTNRPVVRDDDFMQPVQKKLTEIRALSIVADE